MKKYSKYKIIQSYNSGKKIELETNSKIVNRTKLILITMTCILGFFVMYDSTMNIVNAYDIILFILPLIISIFVNEILYNWKLKLEDDTIFIEKGKLFKYKINIDDLIDINESKSYRDIYLEIVYLKKNKMKKETLNLYGFFREELIDPSKINEFIYCFSYDPLYSKDFYNYALKNINRDSEKIECINEKILLDEKIYTQVTIKHLIIAFLSVILGITILFFTVPIIYEFFHG